MENDALNLFGKLLMEEVRDIVIAAYYDIIEDNFVSEESKYLRSMIKKYNLNNDGLEKFITEMVDRTIFKFLFLFEMNENFSITSNIDNTVVNLVEVSDGLAGEIFTEDGWIKKFSEYKQIDDWMEEDRCHI